MKSERFPGPKSWKFQRNFSGQLERPHYIEYAAKPAGPGVRVCNAAVFADKTEIRHLRAFYRVIKQNIARTNYTAYLDSLGIPADIAIANAHNNKIAVGLNINYRYSNAVYECALVLIVRFAAQLIGGVRAKSHIAEFGNIADLSVECI